ncbi:MAG: type II secretion system GspH family protein [Fibrobacter sp.]|nr:type II secretion system GspH family protein [Fibrobacter sp.]
MFGVVQKKGFTLIELMVVIAIMGILSTLGYSSMNRAAINARTKDAAINVAAFVDNMGALATRQAKKLCLKIDGEQTLSAYNANAAGTGCDIQGGVVDKITLEAALRFVSSNNLPNDATTVLSTSSKEAILYHRIGYSPFRGLCTSASECSGEGVYVIQYGTTDSYAAIAKSPVERKIASFVGFEEDGDVDWSEL